ncbi:MAG TPA: adenosylcobinamide-GDP ribazoletransferase [Calditerricola sp.]
MGQRFWLAMQFLTRVPVPRGVAYDEAAMRAAIGYFPLVGFVLGVGYALVDAAGRWLFASPSVSSLFVVGCMLVVTGALHHDGLMDTADGLLSNKPREEMLAILRDSRVGSMGALAGSFALLAHWVLVAALPDPVRTGVLAGAPTLSRWAVVWAMRQWPYAQKGGSVAGRLRHAVAARTLAVATGWALVAWVVALAALALTRIRSGVSLASWVAFALLAPAAVWGTYRGVARFAAARLGGLTGDVYGAIAVATEMAVLAVAVACFR